MKIFLSNTFDNLNDLIIMAERKATNKYYPPDWDPSKGSANTYQKTNHLRKRAKRIQEGVLVVRFEMPFNIICSGCENFIAMGVRYNADKTRNGNYYSTPIYRFKMKCHLCDNYFEIETEPSKFDYKIISGARRQVRYERATDHDDDQIDQNQADLKMKADAMARLEAKVEEKLSGSSNLITLQDLQEWRSKRKDDFKDNQLLRSKYRDRRKKKRQERDAAEKKVRLDKLKLELVDAMKPESRKTQYMSTSRFHVGSRASARNQSKIKKEICDSLEECTKTRSVASNVINKIKSEPS